MKVNITFTNSATELHGLVMVFMPVHCICVHITTVYRAQYTYSPYKLGSFERV